MLSWLRPVSLQWYVLKEFLKSFTLALAVCTIVMLLATLFQRANDLANFNVTVGKIALLSPYFLPAAMTYALPVATLIGAIMAFGRLAAENEIQAAQTAGASVGQLSVYVVLCGFFISMVAVWCNDRGIELGFMSLRDRVLSYENKDFRESIERPGASLTLPLQSGQKLHLDVLPRFEDPASGRELRPIHMVIFQGETIVQSWYARDHEYEPPREDASGASVLRFTLYDGQSVHSESQVWVFKEFSMSQALPPLENQIRFGDSSGTQGFMTNYRQARELAAEIESNRQGTLDNAADLAAQAIAGSPADPGAALAAAHKWHETRLGSETVTYLRDRSHKKMVEFHRKLALSFIPFSMVFLGIGLGLLSRKSQRLVGFILGVLVTFVVYYPLMVVSKEVAASQWVGAEVMWIPNLVIFFLGLSLSWAYQRGYLSGGLPIVRGLRTETKDLVESVLAVSRVFDRVRLGRLLFFRRRADQHVVQALLAPLLTVAVALGLFIVTLDLVEHGNEVFNSIWLAGEEAHRTIPGAILDAMVFYAILASGFMMDFMPVMLLIAGALAVTVMVRNNEHLILKSSGANLRRAFFPMLFVAVSISLAIALLREYAMPTMLMELDRLRPLVYHRGAKTKAMAGQTKDASGRQVIYEIGSYNRNEQKCDNLRVYLTHPEEMKDGRIVRIAARHAQWDNDGDRWLLSDPPLEKGKAGTLAEAPKEIPPGNYVEPRRAAQPIPLHEHELTPQPMEQWQGVLSPSFLDGQNLGPGVVRLRDLLELSDHKPEFRAELWRRGFEWLTGALLLMVCIPVLVRGEVRSPLVGVTKCIAFGAIYVVLGMAATELSQQQLLPSWAPVLPHAIFLLLAAIMYGARMET